MNLVTPGSTTGLRVRHRRVMGMVAALEAVPTAHVNAGTMSDTRRKGDFLVKQYITISIAEKIFGN